MDTPGPVTRLLAQSRAGDREAFNRLMPLVYEHLRAMAANLLRGERPGHTLRPTGLVHEAYLRLVDQRTGWQDCQHFFSIAAQAMRRVLVDYARAYHAEKRGGQTPRVSLDADADAPDHAGREVALDDVIEVDAALGELQALDAFEARVVELRYFGGYTIEEAAAILDVSPALVKREWSVARAWLFRRLSGGGPDGG
jgi:RNA polymerase sigma-70 factor, ECF subfamily